MIGRIQICRRFCSRPHDFVYQNLYASKPAVRNRRKESNFKTYEDLGKMKQLVFREHSEEKGLGPIPSVDECAKTGDYKNPEYFSYHYYTYYDFEVGIQCMHLTQPSALSDEDLLTMVRKTCSDNVEDHSGRCCPPPKCTIDCMKESASGLEDKDAKQSSKLVGTCGQVTEAAQSASVERSEGQAMKENETAKVFGFCNQNVEVVQPTTKKGLDQKCRSNEGQAVTEPVILGDSCSQTRDAGRFAADKSLHRKDEENQVKISDRSTNLADDSSDHSPPSCPEDCMEESAFTLEGSNTMNENTNLAGSCEKAAQIKQTMKEKAFNQEANKCEPQVVTESDKSVGLCDQTIQATQSVPCKLLDQKDERCGGQVENESTNLEGSCEKAAQIRQFTEEKASDQKASKCGSQVVTGSDKSVGPCGQTAQAAQSAPCKSLGQKDERCGGQVENELTNLEGSCEKAAQIRQITEEKASDQNASKCGSQVVTGLDKSVGSCGQTAQATQSVPCKSLGQKDESQIMEEKASNQSIPCKSLDQKVERCGGQVVNESANSIGTCGSAGKALDHNKSQDRKQKESGPKCNKEASDKSSCNPDEKKDS